MEGETYQTVFIPIGDVKLNPDNPRIIKDQAFRRLVKSLKDCPDLFRARPLICSDRTGELVVIGGNMRLKSAQELKYETVPVIIMPGLTEEQEREITIKDNGSFGEWDVGILVHEWSDLPLKEWGITMPEINAADDLVDLIVTEKEWKAANKTAEAAIEALSAKIKKITEDHPREINSAMAVIVNNGSGNAVLFLADPNASDIVKELKRIADAGEHSPLETLVRSLL